MSTQSLGGMNPRRAKIVCNKIPPYWLDHVDHLQLPDGLFTTLTTALIEGRSCNIPFLPGNRMGIGLIAFAVDELRQPLITVHDLDFAVDEVKTDELRKAVGISLLYHRTFNDEEIYDLLWELQCFLREHGEDGHDTDVRFTIGTTMAWCRLDTFQHNEVSAWKRLIFGRFDVDYDMPLVKIIDIDGSLDEEKTIELNNRLRRVVEF